MCSVVFGQVEKKHSIDFVDPRKVLGYEFKELKGFDNNNALFKGVLLIKDSKILLSSKFKYYAKGKLHEVEFIYNNGKPHAFKYCIWSISEKVKDWDAILATHHVMRKAQAGEFKNLNFIKEQKLKDLLDKELNKELKK